MDNNIDKTTLNNTIIKISRLTLKEKSHILNILKLNNIEFTKNSNGYFFNLYSIDENIIKKLNKCIDLIETNRDLINTLDKKRESKLEYFKLLIQEKLNETIKNKRNTFIENLYIDEPKVYITKKNKNTKIISNIDPDILYKNYMKSQKPKKDSVYYKLLQCCNTNKRFKEKKEEIDGKSEIGEKSDIDIEEIDEKSEIGEKSDIDIEEIDEKSDTGESDKEEIDQHSDKEEEIDEHSDVDSENDETKDDLDIQLEFYKKILNTNYKYSFDYDKNVKMQRESYIIH